jgi:hypothetical protein
MTALAESNQDITGTLKNLGDLTHEVGDLVRDNGDRLGGDLERAAKITSTVLKNRASVEESLTWLPVVGEGLTKAHHPPPVSASDVRDNLVAAHCKALDDVPEPVRDVLKQVLGEACGEPPEQTSDGPVAAPVADEPLLDCDKGVRKVRKQLDRVMKVELPERLIEDIVKPMRKQIRRLRKQCDELGKLIDGPEDDQIQELLDELLDDVPDVDDVEAPGVDKVDPLGGAAAGSAPAPTSDQPSTWKRFTNWMAGFVGFLGWAG